LANRVVRRGAREAMKARTALAQATWRRRIPQLPRTADGRLMLHLGCGDINAPGFINVDARPLPHVHVVTQHLFKLYMIPDHSIDLVYMSHVLEHVGHRELHQTLSEFRRVLKPGGTVRISVPDFDKMIEIYRHTGNDVLSIEMPMMGGQDYAFNYHYCLFNHSRLKDSLQTAGFGDVRPWNPDRCENHDFTDWANRPITYNRKDYEVSLNLEADAR